MNTRELFEMVSWRLAVMALVGLFAVGIYGEFAPERAQSAPISLSMKAKAQAPDPKAGPAVEDIWKPAATPRGGVSWALLESTKETTRTDSEGYIVSKPVFPQSVRNLNGRRIKVAGWMMPLDAGRTQSRFVLLAYPPGCPFHFHAAPMQFVEVLASTPFRTDEVNSMVVSGVLELTGQDESGIFYRLKNARPG